MDTSPITISYHFPKILRSDTMPGFADRAYVLDVTRDGDFIAVEIIRWDDGQYAVSWVDPITKDNDSPPFLTLEAAVMYAHLNAYAFAVSWTAMLDDEAVHANDALYANPLPEVC